MSNKLAMPALDKIEVKVQLKLETAAKVSRVAASAHLSRASLIASYVEEGLNRHGVKMTAEDVAEVRRMQDENIAKRAKRKAQKGMK